MSLRHTLAVALVLLASGCAKGRRFRSDSVLPRVGLEAARSQPPERMRVHVIDVGQGSATLFEFPCAAVLVDTGGELTEAFEGAAALDRYLAGFFARRPELNRTLATVFITHPHIDHTRGLPRVLAQYTVKHLVTNGMPRGITGTVLESGGEQQEAAQAQFFSKNTLRTVGRDQVQAGKGVSDPDIDAVACGEVDPKFSVWWGGLKENLEGWEPKVFSNANNHSLVIRVELSGQSMLITGDLEEAAINALVQLHGAALDTDVYLVGHHGSANGTTPALMKQMSPCLAAMSMGPEARHEEWTAWAYGHPRKSAVQTVVEGLGCGRPARDVEVAFKPRRFEPLHLTAGLYATGWEGTVLLELSPSGTWKVTTER